MPRKQTPPPLEDAAPALLPQSPQEFVGFTIYCLRRLSVAPSATLREQVKTLFETARAVVSPAEAFPGWILNVGVACFFTLSAEGEMQAALRVLDEVEALDSELGCNALKAPCLHGRFRVLRSEVARFAAASQRAASTQ